MNFLLIVIVFLISNIGLVWYLANASFFRPYTQTGEANLINILVLLLLIAVCAGLFVSLLVYLGEKFLYCGRNEFPTCRRAIKFGLIVALCALLLLILHTFHFLNFWIALIIVIFVIIVSVVFT